VGTTGGQVVCVQEIVTTGAPAQIALGCDRQGIAAVGRDVAHITVRVLDNQGNLVPTAENPISFDVLGEGQIIGLDNGDPASHEDFRSNQRKAVHGLALAIVQSTPHGGQIQVTATSPGLRPGTTTVSTAVKGA
jgi:beta-galactosidase